MIKNEEPSATKQYIGFTKDVGLIASTNLVVALLLFARLPILSKWLGTSLYGTWSLIWVTISLLAPVATLALTVTIVRFLPAETKNEKVRESFWSVIFIVLATSAFFSLMLVLFSDRLASSIFGDIYYSYFIKLGSIMLITQAVSQISLAFFRAFRHMKRYSGLLVAKTVAQIGLMVCFLLLDWELRGVIFAILASDLLCITASLWAILKQIGFQFPKFTELKSYLKYGLPLIPNTAILWIIHSSDRYMIAYFMETRDVGIYSAAYGLANIVSLGIASLGIVLFPTVSKSYDDKEITQTKIYLKYSLKYLMMLAIPAAFGLSIMASPLLRIFASSEFTTGGVVIPFVSFGIVLFGFYMVCSIIIHLVKKPYWTVALLSISSILNIGLNMLLIPRLGILGAAVATLISYGVLGILTVVVSFRHIKFNLDLPFLIKSVFASGVMALIINLLKPFGIFDCIISIVLGIVVYFGILFLFRGLNKKEVSLFKELVAGLVRRKNRST